jgi:hypothetical protein
MHIFVPSRFHERGASRSSRVLEAGCDGRDCFARRAKRARTAKSCGPGAPRLASSRQVMTAGDGGNNAWSPGRARRKLLKPSRRECRCFGWTCGDYACVLLPFAHKAAGAAKHPAFPAPSVFGGDAEAKLGRDRAAGMRRHTSPSCPAEAGHPVFETSRTSTTVSGMLDRPVRPGDDSGHIGCLTSCIARTRDCRPGQANSLRRVAASSSERDPWLSPGRQLSEPSCR